MKIKAILIILLLSSFGIQAQNMISNSALHPAADTTSAGKREVAIRYPSLRQFYVGVNSYGYSEFTSKLDDQNFAAGKIKTDRVSTFYNTPALKWHGNSLSATVNYTYTSTELKDITNGLADQQLQPLTSDRNTIDLSLNYSRSDSLFHHPIVYSLAARAISDNLNSIRRYNFNGSFSVPLKNTLHTSFSVGLLVLIDPSAGIPLRPIVNYYHKFAASKIELIVDIPAGITLKKQVGTNAWVMLETNQNSYSIFYDKHNAYLDGKISYNTIELKNGAAFEYLFAKNLMLSVGGGLNSIISSRIFKDGENFKDASIIGNAKSSPYVNVNLSLLSF